MFNIYIMVNVLFEYKYRTWSLWITCGVLAGGIIVYIKTYWYTILKKNN